MCGFVTFLLNLNPNRRQAWAGSGDDVVDACSSVKRGERVSHEVVEAVEVKYVMAGKGSDVISLRILVPVQTVWPMADRSVDGNFWIWR